MAETFTRRVNIYIDSGQAQAAYDKLLAKQKDLTAKTQDYINKGKEVPEKIAKQLETVTAALDRQSKKISGELSPNLKDLRDTYTRLSRELNAMSKEDPGFARKQKETVAAKLALDNYRLSLSGLKEGFKNLLKEAKGVAFGVLIGNSVQAGVESIIAAGKAFLNLKNEFDSSVRELSAITGAAGDDLNYLRQAAIDMSTTGSRSAKEFVEAMKFIASAKPELLENKAALVEVTKAANLLAKASGLDLPEASKRLTDALNQYGAPASEATKYVDALAAAAKYGAAEVPGITESLLEFGAIAKQSNIDIYESSAAIELLAEKGVKGAEAGTKLRNVFLTLSAVDSLPKQALEKLAQYGVNTELLSDKTKSLEERLTELSKVSGDANAMMQIFDKQNVVAGSIMLENIPRLAQLTQQVKEQGVAAVQASTNVGGFGNAWGKLINVIQARLLDIDLSGIANTINMFTKLINTQKEEKVVLEQVRQQMNINLEALKSTNLSSKARAQLLEETNSRYGEYLPNLLTEKSTLEDINVAQEAGNKLIQTKILTMAYEEELTAILKEQAAAQQQMVNEQIRRSKLNAMGAGDATGLSASQVEQIKRGSAAFEAANKRMADGTGAKLDELKKRYALLAETAKVAFETITGGGTSSTKSGGGDPKSTKINNEKDLNAEIMKLRHELLLDQMQEQAREIQLIRDKYKEKRKLAHGDAIALKMIAENEAADISEVMLKYEQKYGEMAKAAEEGFKRVEAAAQNWFTKLDSYNPNLANKIKGELDKIKDDFESVIAVLKGAADFMSTIFQIMDQEEQQALEKDRKRNDEKKANLEDRLRSGRLSQKAYAREIARIEKEQEQKRKEASEKAFKRNKAIQITMAVINTASAVMSALSTSGNIYAGIALAAVAAATGAAQIALIAKSQPPEYESGTEAWRSGIGGDRHSDKSRGNPILDGSTGQVLGRMEEGEAILPRDSTAANRGAIKWMIANRGKPLPRFANSMMEYAAGTSFWLNHKSTASTPAQVFDDVRANGKRGFGFKGTASTPAQVFDDVRANGKRGFGFKGTASTPAQVFDDADKVNGALLNDVLKELRKPRKVVFVKEDYDRFTDKIDYANTRTTFDA